MSERTTRNDVDRAFTRFSFAVNARRRAQGREPMILALDYYAAGGGYRVVETGGELGSGISTTVFGERRVPAGEMVRTLRIATAAVQSASVDPIEVQVAEHA